MSAEGRPQTYEVQVTPGVPFGVRPNFTSLDLNPECFREKATKVDEGIIVDTIGLNIARGHAKGMIRVIEISSGFDAIALPVTFPGGDIRPYTFEMEIFDLNQKELNRANMAILFNQRHFNANTDFDEVCLEDEGKADLYHTSWTESGYRESTLLGFRRSEIPNVNFLITGFDTKSPLWRLPLMKLPLKRLLNK
ncbi:MAG: hypothetical protein US86_C0003G0042 [Candidatus Daviesbacteria bacterium GW2011_GWA2_38_24]|uniref:Uncharacterized protein n=1 Tax=Candidatus Daviesbacteria bacterium GW2011_GWA2_38_24 TaxID=1618422 RepID=A0A0G0LZJ5_9BACT|nr:MAG: hypothetical protein US86_C0003G0042 [Candidatus Daviesbacteria bacterium GW2011_GWA2_38_24]KKQ80351.1 MAG: hypothetical protein UT01_C0014G0010 [Candidatus Daviesbacteria bacterium GW2011_GWA1_38_7]OGE24657.1 MAG: hypothetical protein A2688_01175 [Candidatus Daviesbacteria bacterium RIFCSPHIGHO2_01_FULL_38_8]